MTRTVPVWVYAEVNPATPEFKTLDDGTEVSFMPLETIWPGGKADYTNTLLWSSKQSYSQFRRGDILVPKITPTFEAGRTIIAEIPISLGLASTEVHVVRANGSSNPRFLQYCFQSLPFLDEGAHSLQGVGNLRRITPRFVQEYEAPNVTLDVQCAIADYLDRETGEIDAMIATMDELAETLVIRRLEMIKHAFVDGSTVSGPTPVFALATSEDNRRIPVKAEERAAMSGEYPYYGASGVIDHLDQFIWDNETRVLVSEDGANLLARNHPIAFSASGRYWVNNHAHVLRPNLSVDHRLICYAFSITDVQHAITGSAQPKLTAEAMWRLKIPFPLDHRCSKELADHLDKITGRIDAMLGKVAELRSLLVERRAALITDVVTGRKKVA